ncbi:bifunctional diguanylate cyclase/phosphodiesterase [Aromatoleum aromaticum]|uniref:bifunctional diguanylate cyclase/phosphodiesterase n=1 Tax=Aromatoleum aromaticum TaxID=551760 RepID=UPI0014593EC6|nr:EAL domain-containing protein [Aromatoleum aromaticum]NMG53511.1 EAL domain-containing protein [Aromatoleum aromaticum]
MNYAERALRTLSAGNRTLLRAENETSLLQEMCRVIVEQGGYRMAWVGFAQHDEGKTLRPIAHYGFEDGFFEVAHYTWADYEGGPTAEAVRTGKPAMAPNATAVIATHLPMALSEVAKRGYGSVAAFPLILDGATIGNLTIFAAEHDAFDARELELLGEMSEDLSFGIATLRVREGHRRAEETIRRMAFYDSLTDLPNRTSLQQELTSAIETLHTAHNPLALLLIKIGHFQEISDTLGYEEADLLVQEMARRLSQLAGEGRAVARAGEDEFALSLPNTSAEVAIRLAQRIMREVCDPVPLGPLTVDPHAHIGIAMFPGHGNTADAILRRAKIAAVQAKRTVAKFALYQGSADQECTRRLALMSDLRSAIDKNELQLYCQPKVSISSGEVCGAEALVRWPHAQHGMIATGEFITLAERAGLIMPLTRWVLETAFRQSHTWFEQDIRQPLSVNLSAQDLRDPRLVDRISGLFATWAMPPEMIQFELTESALMEDPIGALKTLQRLKALGVELFIDDFGTGYSSLSYLQKLPVDSLKIDQSFVSSMLTNAGSAVIVRSTVELGHNLGLGVVAEGVESEAQWDGLRALGCDTAQGHFVGFPIPTEQFADWEAHCQWRHRPTAGDATPTISH